MSSNLQEFKKLRDHYSPSDKDYSNSFNIINSFFDEYLIPNIQKWDLCIRVDRRGSQLYLNQKLSKMDLKLLCDFSVRDIQNYAEVIKGKSLLIFDDSIKEGRIIRELLETNRILSSASEITVAVLLSNGETIERLRSEYPKVKFYSQIETSRNNFSKNYLKKIQPYLDCICLPLQKDHPLLSIDLDESFEEDVILDIFNRYGYISTDEHKKIVCKNCNKKLFEFNKDAINELPIFESLKNIGALDKDTKLEDIVIIRLYIRTGHKSQIILQPIVLEGFTEADYDDVVSVIDNYVKGQIIYQFLINKILPNLINAGVNISRFSVLLK